MSSCYRVRVRLTLVNRRAWAALGLFSVGLLLAILAQRELYQSGEWRAGALVYGLAFAFLIAAWARDPDGLTLPFRRPKEALAAEPRLHPARQLFVLPSILLALIAFANLSENEFTLVGMAAWLGALALFLIAFWQGSPRALFDSFKQHLSLLTQRDARGRRARLLALALTGIIVIGIFFYFYRLDAIPAEMTSDHAEKILDTYGILNGKYSIFFERNTGREPLQFYLNALVVELGIAPLDMLALKTVGAFAGVLAIPGVFLLAREFFDDEVGLFAAFLFAVSFFPLALARIGLRYPLSPLFVAWTLFFLARALRNQRRNDFLAAGLLMGVGLNGYSPFRVVVLLALVWLGLGWWLDSKMTGSARTHMGRNALLMTSAAVLVFLPLLSYLTEHPANFTYRMATRLTSLEVPVPGNPLLIFLENNLRAAGMFNLRGDSVWVSALPNLPIVDWILGACFLIGVAYGVYRLAHYHEVPFVLIFSALFILLLPSTLALAFPEENPSVVRSGGIAPIVMILAALPLALWRRQFARVGAVMLGTLCVGVVLLGITILNFNLYFSRYDEQYRRAAWNSTEIADTLREFAVEHNDWEHIYIVSAPHWVDYRAVGIHLGMYDFGDHLVRDADEFRAQQADPAPKLYALKSQDIDNLNLLRALYPEGVTRRMTSRTPGREYIVFYAPGR